ncbi:hypothetical protein Sjap_022857 [Stephania japonica]|uniref:C2H2-type domain-containing protein n=1 Tax=Stephania japonica TaxID=461633 RepID=A0AAP0EPM5_9MAGN
MHKIRNQRPHQQLHECSVEDHAPPPALPAFLSYSYPQPKRNANLQHPPPPPTPHPPPPPKLTSPHSHSHSRRRLPISASQHEIEIDMVRNPQGVYTPKAKKVVILWDLDNKPPRGPPYEAAMSLKHLAHLLGHLVDISAYANRHAFLHLPEWVLQERRHRRRLDSLERSSPPADPYLCAVCGRKCRTHADLKKHFKQLHERERQKKLNRMGQLKGKKRQRYKERFVTGNVKFEEAARELIRPKAGYGLAAELRRAGVFVKMVEDKPQAADWAVKRQMQHSISRGIDWMVLVSDDKDFGEMVRRAREGDLRTLVVGDTDGGLGRYADLWLPWVDVENGEVREEDLFSRSPPDGDEDEDDGVFSVTRFDGKGSGGGDLDEVVDEIVGGEVGYNGVRISAFSEGEWDEDQQGIDNVGDIIRPSLLGKDLFWDCEDSEEEDDYF